MAGAFVLKATPSAPAVSFLRPGGTTLTLASELETGSLTTATFRSKTKRLCGSANTAASQLQTSMINDNTPAGEAWKKDNAAKLMRKAMKLGTGLWKERFNVGLGVSMFEVVVESVRVVGPRNV